MISFCNLQNIMTYIIYYIYLDKKKYRLHYKLNKVIMALKLTQEFWL